VGHRAGLDGRKISSPHRDSIPDRPDRSSVAIPNELPGPLRGVYVRIYSNAVKFSPQRKRSVYVIFCEFYKDFMYLYIHMLYFKF